MEKAEINAAILHIYNSEIVKYGPPETTCTNIITGVNTYFASIGMLVTIGPTFDLNDVIRFFALTGVAVGRSGGGDGSH